jgi:polar amino acid transport system substrate-binding protein
MKTIKFRLLFLAMVLLLLPAIAPGQEQRQPVKVSLQLQWKHQFEFAGFYAAREKGYYADAGLEVDIREYEKGIDIIGSVLSREATFGLLYSTVIQARMEGKPLLMLANYFKRSPLALAVKPDIYFPGDLKGKTVMGEKYELDSANFAMIFRPYNITSDDFKVVPHTFSIDKFVNNEVDAMTVYLTNEVYDLRRKKVPFNIIDPSNYGAPLYDVCLFTSEAFAGENPSAVRSFIEASNKGWAYALANKAEIVDLILAKYNSQNKSKQYLMFEADKTHRMVQPDIYPIGSIDPVRVKKISELFASQGVALTTVDPQSFIFGSRTRKAITLTPDQERFVKDHRVVRVVRSFHHPPFTVHEEGSTTGYLHDLLSEVIRIAGFKVQYVQAGATYDDMVNAVQHNRADLLPHMNSIRQLPGSIVRTIPVATTPNVLVARISAPYIKETSDLFGKRVAVVKGSAQDQYLNRFPQIQQVHVAGNEEGFNALRMGTSLYFINDRANATYVLEKTFATDLRIGGELSYRDFPPLSLSFAVNQKDPMLPIIINKALGAVSFETQSRLRKKWLDKEHSPAQADKYNLRLTIAEKSWLQKHPVIKLANRTDRPPFCFVEDGVYQGIGADYMKLLEDRLGIELRPVTDKPWGETLKRVKRRQLDVFPCAAQTPVRQDYMLFTNPYHSYPLVVLTRDSVAFLAGPQDLKGQKVAVIQGSVTQDLLKQKYPEIVLHPVSAPLDGISAVSREQCFAYVGNLATISHILREKGLVHLKISGSFPHTIDLSMGVRDDWPMLASIFQKGLDSITESEKNAISQKWLPINYTQQFDYKLFWKIFSITATVIGLGLGIIIFWNRRLAREVAHRSQIEGELRVAMKSAEKANQAKSTFFANMSHELRTPLNAILGFSELMGRDSNLSPGQLDSLEIIERSGEHLLSLINDVLDLSKIEAGQIDLKEESFDLHHLLAGLEEIFRLRAHQKGISMVFSRGASVPCTICTDQKKLRQILINLLGNAVKFTESGSISLLVKKRETNAPTQAQSCILGFEVIDTGQGIAQDEQDRIFDSFYQADGGQRSSSKGTGLGLPISRKFVEMLGGKLEVRSNSAKGTVFSFDIPVKLADEAPVVSSRCDRKVIGLEAGQPSFRMLVVEDNEHSRHLLVTLLRTIGFELDGAVNGKEAIAKWRKWQPHLIWMDMRMPIMDGYEATALIKSEMQKDEPEVHTKIIALTASAFEEDRLKVIENGCNDFVRKPFRASEIFEMIEKHIGVRYVFEEDDEGLEPGISSENIGCETVAPSIDDLPERVIASLKEATELSDTDMLDKVIEQIRGENAGLAEALSKLADNFAYDRILDLIPNRKRCRVVE